MSIGQKKYFVQLIQKHQGIINSLCRVYYAQPEDQKDARQDIILQLWKALPHFRQEAQISTWIYKISLHTLLSKIRQEKKQLPTEPLEKARMHRNIEQRYADDDLQQVLQIIHSLKARDKALIILFLEGYKNKEIAGILDLSPTNVSTRINRIKSELKKKYQLVNYENR